jgi:hypothetical protein
MSDNPYASQPRPPQHNQPPYNQPPYQQGPYNQPYGNQPYGNQPPYGYQRPQYVPPPDPLKAPAICMISVSGLSILAYIIDTILKLPALLSLGAGNVNPDQFRGRVPTEAQTDTMFAVVLVLTLVFFAMSCFTLFGGIRMLQKRDFALVRNAAICACIPCISPCVVLGIPFGIWALVLLNNDRIVAQFKS